VNNLTKLKIFIYQTK